MSLIDTLELSLIAGEPVNPKKPIPDVLVDVVKFDTAQPRDHYYYFDVLADTNKVYVVTGNGQLTQEAVSPDTPVLLSFVDLVSPEYYVLIPDLMNAKEDTIARKVDTINRAMNNWEVFRIITLIDQAATNEGNTNTLQSGNEKFTYSDLIAMIENVLDYADEFTLWTGAQVNNDIVLWDYDENKFHSLELALQRLKVKITRINHTVTIDGSATNVIGTNDAYLIGTNTAIGKPLLFVRKKIDTIATLGGIIVRENGDKPERIVLTTSNPVPVGASNTRTLGVGFTGYEQVGFATLNPKAMSKFYRG